MSERIGRFRGWIWLGLAFAVVAALSIISATQPGPDRPLDVGNARPDGGLALFTWLSRVGYHVYSTERIDFTPAPGRTLLFLAPQRDLTRQELEGVRALVRGGGRVVLVTDGTAWKTFGALGMPLAPAVPAAISVTEPLLLSPPVARLSGQTDIVERSPVRSVSVAATDSGSVLTLQSMGRGRLWLLTAPELLDNAHIAHAQNGELALNLAGPRGAAVGFVELGPEALPDTGRSGNWLTDTVWGASLLLCLALVLLYRWLAGWRLGPPRIPFSERRRPAVEYVVSLADLLRRGRKRSDVLRVYQRGLRRVVIKRVGGDDVSLIPKQLREQVEPLLEDPGALTEDELLQRVRRILECEEEVRSMHV